MQIKFKSEMLAFLFGVLVILLIFGDQHMSPTIGNLDTIFGLRFWPLLDAAYFLGSIGVFLAYGHSKGGALKFNPKTLVPLTAFVVALFMISVDDFFSVLSLDWKLPEPYWIAAMWLYLVVSFFAFFCFGEANEKINQTISEQRKESRIFVDSF
jgi:hypothetical protein